MTKYFSLTSMVALIISLTFMAGMAFAEEVTVETETDVEVTTTENEDSVDEVDENESEEEDTTEENQGDADQDENTLDDEEESTTENEEEIAEEEDTTEEEGSDLRAKIKARMELQAKQRQILQERKEAYEASLQERAEEKRSTIIHAHVALAKRITIRLKNLHERLSLIVEKVTERAEEMKEQGVDTEKTMTQIATAQLHLDDTALTIGELDAMIDAWVEVNVSDASGSINETLRENKETFKGLVETSGESLRAAHKSIKDALRILKAAAKEIRIESTTDTSANVDAS